MDWFAEFEIDDIGRCLWREGMRVDDPKLVEACRLNPLVQFFVEESTKYGVKVGQA